MSDHRFGISLYSKSNYATAYNEEVLIDKKTGEILIKTPDGDTISYNYNARISSHITSTKIDANNLGIYGDIINVKFDNIICPFVMDYDTNYLDTPLDIPYACERLLIHVDIDALTTESNGFSQDRNNMMVELIFNLKYSDGTISDISTVSYPINVLNSKILHLQDNSIMTIDTDKELVGIQIQSFKILNTVMDYKNNEITNTAVIRPICNSILMVLEV